MLAQSAHQHGIRRARPALPAAACRRDRDTIFASVREGASAVCVAREIGAFPIRTLSLGVGDRGRLGVGSGSLALLAFLPDDQIETIIGKNAAWLARYPGHRRKEILAKVAETRRRGYSFVDGKILPGMNAIGVPVLDAAAGRSRRSAWPPSSQRVIAAARALGRALCRVRRRSWPRRWRPPAGRSQRRGRKTGG